LTFIAAYSGAALGMGKVRANPFCSKDIVVLRIFPAQNVRCLAKAV
jgi:hypothetical protein